MTDLDEVTLLSITLFGLTAFLMLAAHGFGRNRIGQVLALSSIATVCGVNYAMMLSYKGEKELFYERAGPIERRVIHRRGSFEYVDKDDGDGGAGASDRGGQATAGAENAGSAAGEGGSATGGNTGNTGDGSGNGSGNGNGAQSGPSSLLASLAARFATPSLAETRQSSIGRTFQDCANCPEMVIIEPGYFRMGAAQDDPEATSAEQPQRMIRIPKRFAIGRSEVTLAQYMAFVKASGHPAGTCAQPPPANDPLAPAGCVSWHDAKAYVAWLNTTTGRSYRLPTEAEWEWAARAGSEQRFITGRTPLPQAVNGNGLVNVHGGVAEMVEDCWSETLSLVPGDGRRPVRNGDCRRRVLRDAGASEPVLLARLSARRPVGLYEQRPTVGFRIALDL